MFEYHNLFVSSIHAINYGCSVMIVCILVAVLYWLYFIQMPYMIKELKEQKARLYVKKMATIKSVDLNKKVMTLVMVDNSEWTGWDYLWYNGDHQYTAADTELSILLFETWKEKLIICYQQEVVKNNTVH